MIGQSMINVTTGGRRNLSGIAAALFLLSFILFASPLIERIPLAALVGVMFMVVLGTFEWGSFRLLGSIPPEDALVGILVAVVTVATDLAVAVTVGVIVSALVFAWKQARHVYVVTSISDAGAKVYEVHGPIFFASVHRFAELFDPAEIRSQVVVDFAHSRVADHSAIEAIDTSGRRYAKAGKQLHLRHLSPMSAGSCWCAPGIWSRSISRRIRTTTWRTTAWPRWPAHAFRWHRHDPFWPARLRERWRACCTRANDSAAGRNGPSWRAPPARPGP